MAIKIEKVKRKFNLEKNGQTISLTDPNPAMTVSEVMDFYSTKYPELLNAKESSEKKDGEIIYNFKTIAGTKG